ncbi:MAG: peptide deformylase [Bacilli bacterium]|nr:peptide deformylase [Bacilli bacterium]
MKLKIVKDSDPIMRQRSQPVEMPLSKEDKALLDQMLDYLIKSQDDEYAKKHNIKAGVGMAAIQVGVLKRMFVIYYPKDEETVVQYQLVNPVIIEESMKKCALESGEGCLSVDENHEGLVHRHFKIVMKAYDALQKEDIVITARGYDAIVLQHEYDHLNGLFYYDRIDSKNPDKKLINEELI